MNDDDLRARLARVDPTRGSADTEGPTAQEIRERVMQTIDQDVITTDPARPARWRRPALVAAAAASVAGLALGAAVLAGGDGTAKKTDRTPTTLALKAAPGGDGTTSQSCVMFDVNFLKEMPVAFAGTVTAVGAGSVTLDVDRWYKGGDADVVTVSNPDNASVALDGVEFTDGGHYLVTATDGTVNGCGFSGPASTELERAYAEAFGG
jgi:hypothetical protein